jgi:hypothetical protein
MEREKYGIVAIKPKKPVKKKDIYDEIGELQFVRGWNLGYEEAINIHLE